MGQAACVTPCVQVQAKLFSIAGTH